MIGSIIIQGNEIIKLYPFELIFAIVLFSIVIGVIICGDVYSKKEIEKIEGQERYGRRYF